MHSPTNASQQNSFAERFKYDIISSSLLSSTLAASLVAPTNETRRTVSPEPAGKLSATGDHHPSDASVSHLKSLTDNASNPDLNLSVPIVLLSISAIILSTGHYLLALLSAAAIYAKFFVFPHVEEDGSMTQVSSHHSSLGLY